MNIEGIKRGFAGILKSDFATLFFIVIGWRLFITAAGIIGIMMLNPADMPTVGVSYGTFWDMWTRWDGWHYINISQNGYANPQLTAFFPLYPLLINLISTVLPINPSAAGLLISHISLLGALYFIFRIIKDIYSREIAYTSILLLLFFPTAIFLGMVYTESLFLFLAAGTMFFARTKRWWLVFLFSFFAALTRNLGVLLVLPLAFEYFHQHGFRVKKAIIALLGPVLGASSYMFYLFKTFGNPLEFIRAQSAWNRFLVINPISIVTDKFLKIISSIQHHDVFMGIEIFVGFSFLVILALSLRKKYRMPKSFIAYMFVMLFPGLLQNTWASVNRYVIVIFPAFLLMALMLEKKPILKYLALAGFSIFLGVSVLLFVNFRWAG